jgi:3-oxoadipate enol-lactonase
MKVSVNGIDIHYTVDGEGPWVVLSHSLACNVHMWDEETRRLSRSFKVLRFDTRGHGASSATSGPYTLDLLADDLYGLLKALEIPSTHFVGLSMGGMIGQAFAIKYPGVFTSLALCDTTSRYPAQVAAERHARIEIAQTKGMEALVEQQLGRWVTGQFMKERPDVVSKLEGMIRSTSVPGYVGCTLANMNVNFTERLKEIRCPTLVLVGDQDHATPVAMAEVMHRAISGSELAVIASAPHLANIEQPDAFNGVLGQFLDKVVR